MAIRHIVNDVSSAAKNGVTPYAAKMTIGQRIKAARRSAQLTQAELAEAVDVDQSTVAHWERDKNRPSEEKYEQIAKVCGTTTEWLQYARGTAPKAPAGKRTARHLIEPAAPLSGEQIEIGGDTFISIPVYDTRVSAGPGTDGSDDVLHRLLFRADWLRSVTTAMPTDLGVVEVDNDSMEPTLRSGDTALVDTTQKKPSRKDGVYIIRRDEGLQVKRLSAHPENGKLTIVSDNSHYPTYSKIDPRKVDVIGRVIWIGRRL